MGYFDSHGCKFGKRDNAIPRYNEALQRWKQFNKLFLVPGSKGTPQTLAWSYLKAVRRAGGGTRKMSSNFCIEIVRYKNSSVYCSNYADM